MSGKVFPIYNNFRGGEISPLLACRTDLDLRNQSCYTLENMLIRLQGGAFRRPGSIYVASTKYAAKKARIIIFETPLLTPYKLEFGDQYIRFFRDAKPICTTTGLNLISNGLFTTDLTGWDDRDTGTGASAQAAGTMSLPAGAAGVAWREQDFSTTAGTWYRVYFQVLNHDVKVRIGSASMDEDIVSDLEFTAGNRFIDFRAVSATTYLGFKNAVNNDAGIDEVYAYALTPYEVATPYLEADLPLVHARNSPDGMFFWHESYQPRKLVCTDDTHWTLTAVEFTGGPFLQKATTPTITPSATGPGTITLTASSALWQSGHVGALWMVEQESGSTLGRRVVRITGYTSPTVVTAETVESIDKQGDKVEAWRNLTATTNQAEGCWSDVRGWPRTACFHEDRLVPLGTTYEPQGIWGSQSPDPLISVPKYTDFWIGPLDSDAWYYTLGGNSEGSDVIQTVGSLDALIIGTASGELSMKGGSSGPITPTNVLLKPEGSNGMAARLPIRVGNALIYLQRDTRKFRAMSYAWESSSFNAIDLTWWAEHITGNGVDGFAWQKSPDPILWAHRNDGVLIAATVDISQNMIAWGRHVIGGTDAEVESVAVAQKACGDSSSYEYRTETGTLYRVPESIRFGCREVKHVGGGNPNFAFSITAPDLFTVISSGGSVGVGFAFANFSKDWLDDKYVQIRYKVTHTNEGGPPDAATETLFLRLYDGSYDESSDADFPEGSGTTGPLIKGAGLLQTIFAAAMDAAYITSAIVQVNASSATLDDVSLFFAFEDGLADRGRNWEVDWIKIFADAGGTQLLIQENFTGAVTMVRTGTFKDYGSYGAGVVTEVTDSQEKVYAPSVLRNEVWLEVARTVGGSTVRHIERLAEINTATLADCCREWSGLTARASLTGLNHLIGQSVDVIGDGTYQAARTVDGNGAVIVNPAASTIIAGLGYTPEIETVPPEVASPTGTVLGKTKKWLYATAYLYDTTTCYINGILTTADAAKWAKVLNLGWTKDNRITITQTGAKPLNVLAIAGDLEVTQ